MARIAALATLALVVGLGLFAALRGSGTDSPAPTEVTAAQTSVASNDTSADEAVDEPAADDAAVVADQAVADDADVAADIAADEPPAATPAGPDIETPPFLGTEGELVNLDGWLQSDISSLDDLDGTVHVVQFWTFGCFNCKNTLDNMAQLYERHQDDNFEVVGVHAPEFEYEKDPDSILAAAQDLNVTWPIALDTDKTNFRSWQESRRFWPRTFVIDQNGEIRFDRIGEGAYQKLNDTVAWLLANPPAPA